ncbi:GMC family oxidoreductase [Actinomadura sp. NTSP31]|uniref:GMC family oxidoreductase n=1 Tax=Actinomadura sp. NTSP31 TaxID=1735447 RepID=UPI0035C083CD
MTKLRLAAPSASPPGVDRTVPGARRAVAETYRRTINVWAPVQEIPTRDARVRTATTVTDHLGLPVARLKGRQHPEDLRTLAFLSVQAQKWLRASGATRTWTSDALRKRELSGDQHQSGTARMSDSPRYGATDPHGKLWGTDRIFIADASLHVTNGGANPVLTIMALAWRTATRAAAAG